LLFFSLNKLERNKIESRKFSVQSFHSSGESKSLSLLLSLSLSLLPRSVDQLPSPHGVSMTEERPVLDEEQAAGSAATAMETTTDAAVNAAAVDDDARAAAAPPPPTSTSTTTTTVPAPKLAAALACNFCARVLLDAVVAPNCMHAFCAPCIDAWVEARAAACPCCVALGARQPTPLGDGAYTSARLQPDLTLRALASKVMPFKPGEMGSKGASSEEEEWNARFAQALAAARRGAAAARGFLAEGAPCVGGVSSAVGAAGVAASNAAAAAAAAAANAAVAGMAMPTTAAGAPRFNRAAPPPRGSAVFLLLTADPDAPRRRNPGYLQRPYVRAPGTLTVGLLGRYLSDRMKVTASSVKWRFEARGAVKKRGSESSSFSPTTTHEATAAVAAVVAARGTAATMAELARAAWGEEEEDLERLDRPLVAFYRT